MLRVFRDIESRHERDAILLLAVSVAHGRLNKTADKQTTRGILRGV